MADLIDTLQQYLRTSKQGEDYYGITYSDSTDNKLELLDTPRQWGKTVQQINSSKHLSDDGDYGSWLIKAIRETVAAAEELVDITTLGPLPTGAFKQAFFAGIAALARKKVVVRVLVSKYAQNAKDWGDELFFHLKSKVDHDLDQLKLSLHIGYVAASATSWNHAKIVAVDGKRAIVGGHNWWAEDYLDYPPVNDVSLRVTGPAAYDAHAFANHLWSFAKANLGGISKLAAAWFWKPGKKMDKLGAGEIHLGVPSQRPKAGSKAGRMLALGRLGPMSKHEAGAASDVAKLVAIDEAQELLCLSQQDLLLPLPNMITPHPVIDAIAEALLKRPSLEVRAVLSSPQGGSGKNAYVTGNLERANSRGYGAADTHAYVKKRILALAPSIAKKYGGNAEQLATSALRRLKIATLRMSAKDTTPEAKYAWPGGFKIRCIAGTADMLAAPANHAKVYIVDDRAFYFGSDNLYPNANQEFGYLVEDETLTAWFIKSYWDKLWEASKGSCVGGA